MAFSSLFRKKTVQDILKQIENEADAHEALWSTFNGKRFGFGIAAIVGAGILVQLVRLV
jgi:hypothetical protein